MAISIREGRLTAGQGAGGSSCLCPALGLTQPAAPPAQMVEHPFFSVGTSFPVPYLVVVYPECFFPVSSPSINAHAEFFKPEFSRDLPLVFHGVSFFLFDTFLILTTDHSVILVGRQSPAQAGSAVGSEQVTQGLVQSGL